MIQFAERQLALLPTRPRAPLLKWVGNKYRHAETIASHFPFTFQRYFEPFVGTAAVLATLCPTQAIAGDTLSPLIDLWHLLQRSPENVTDYYAKIISRFNKTRISTYNETLDRYNSNPNALDLLIISRTCYGGVIRFTRNGKISTPIGPHKPISGKSFSQRAVEWRERITGTTFLKQSFPETMALAQKGDLVYCDPPYVDSQRILYGAQGFSLVALMNTIEECKQRGAMVALSIDGRKFSGTKTVKLSVPRGLFETEIYLECGSSMLKRFQKRGENMIGYDVHDRLLLTW